MKNRIIIIFCFVVFFLLNNSVGAEESIQKISIVVPKPTFVLPKFTGPYSEREASISPEEYETADRLRELLDNNKTAEVLKELDKFYDIELSAAMLSLKAQIYFSLQMYKKAEKTFLTVLSRKPQLVRVHRDLAQLYLIQENNKKARFHFAKAISFGSQEAVVHGQLGYLNLTMHGPFSAISEYQKALALEPENTQWQQGLLQALSQAKMYESAQALISELLVQNPNDKDLWLNQAALSLNMNNTKQALSSLEMAILLGIDDDKNIKTAAQLHLQLGSYDRAVELINVHFDKSELDMNILDEYLVWLRQVDMWDHAEQLLEKLSYKLDKMTPSDKSIFYSHKANVNNHQKKYKAADSYFIKAIDLGPDNGEALLNYANFLNEQKKLVKAELLFSRAEVIEEVKQRAMLGKAQLYLNMHNFSSALSQLQKVHSRYPELQYLPEQINIVSKIIQTNSKSIKKSHL